MGSDRITRYRLDTNWPSLPSSVKLGNPTGIALDTNKNVVVLHRADRKWPLFGPMPQDLIKQKTVLFINKDNGKLLHSWGDQLFIMPHGLTVDRENNLWITDLGLHQVFKFSHEGRLLLQLGEAGVAGNDSAHFNMPTGVAVADDGSFYVSDGYGNSRILRFTADGKYLSQWGTKGNQPGEFNIPHGITINNKGWVYVADRENNRIQVFNAVGTFIKQLSGNWGAVNSVDWDPTGLQMFASDDVAFLKMKHRGSDILVFDTDGKLQTRIGRSGFYKGPVTWYHDLATDSEGNIYVGDILGNTIQKFKKLTK
ncbi:peptidyl-alpha-hydroxyglycine alpha-amidating lyase family protein [Niabella hibiscisoli]|uniref:peptidyl-alpha-hydroxyglycine alpha-amidating lyase family protein n=1 Tax=Niabella hibiscisoli TaxID=1825928 RepID=UPI001F102FE4|nr:peptidyl-alpha-hydroxyglycine alpha-amidating lyase family protein [Niabella hibiscisoli]MCH5715842.1 peptidyl-alpha-hydroxyglycine alpha-amidating lyase family protein [Niabella hibiscisoli]